MAGIVSGRPPPIQGSLRSRRRWQGREGGREERGREGERGGERGREVEGANGRGSEARGIAGGKAPIKVNNYIHIMDKLIMRDNIM